MSKQCGYCVYMDKMDYKEGKYKCEKDKCYKFATATDAENCRYYCEHFRRDMYLAEQAIETSKKYQAAHKNEVEPPCYITTIVVDILGFADDCKELKALRKLRKEVMQKDPKYQRLLVEYDALGPSLARLLSLRPDAFDFAADLYYIFIKEAAILAEIGDYEGAITLYSEMMNALVKEYVTNYVIPEEVYKNYDMNSAGHGQVSINKA